MELNPLFIYFIIMLIAAIVFIFEIIQYEKCLQNSNIKINSLVEIMENLFDETTILEYNKIMRQVEKDDGTHLIPIKNLKTYQKEDIEYLIGKEYFTCFEDSSNNIVDDPDCADYLAIKSK